MKISKIQIDFVITPEVRGNSKLYNAYSVQIPNVVTQGKTIEEAKKMLQEALELYFEEAPKEKQKLIKTMIVEEDNAPLISRMFL